VFDRIPYRRSEHSLQPSVSWSSSPLVITVL
jgi:hypothetical protein